LETGIDFEHKIIDLKNKPAEFVAKYQQANGGSGSGLVPLLENGDELVIESDVVAKYIGKHLDPQNILYPQDSCQRVDTFLDTWEQVTDRYYDFLRATSLQDAQQREGSFLRALEAVEDQLLERTGNFLLGNDFSVAECICAPWIQRFYVALPYFRGIDFEAYTESKLPCTARWMKAVRERPSVQESMCPEEEMIAACKRYYVSYISPGASGRL